jgi:hypothetical protein
MKLHWLASAALALGVASVVPSFAKADDWRHDRDRYEYDHRDDWRRDRYEDRRDDHRRYERDFDVDVPVREVPRAAFEVANYERRGRRIEAVQYVFRDGKYFYRFRIDDPGWRDRDVNIRVTPGGRLLTIEEAGR